MSACCTRWSATCKRSRPSHDRRSRARPNGSCRFGSRWPKHFSVGPRSRSGCLEQGIDTLEKQRGFLQRAQLIYWLPTYLCWLTEAHLRAANLQDAKSCLAQARDFSRRGGNSWYEVECLRLEGRLAAAAGQSDATAAAERCFEQALAVADQRGQRGFALRTARDLAALLAGKGEPARAHVRCCRAEFAFFMNQPEGGDRTDAKALLCSLRGASPR